MPPEPAIEPPNDRVGQNPDRWRLVPLRTVLVVAFFAVSAAIWAIWGTWAL